MTPAADPAEWLEANAVRCERYRALLSPSACRQHQVLDPESCRKCPRVTEADPGRGLRFRAVPARRRAAKKIREEVTAMAKKRITCRDCGAEEQRNKGRGLCPKCYDRHRRAGTLERFDMLVVPQPASGDKATADAALRDELEKEKMRAANLRQEMGRLEQEKLALERDCATERSRADALDQELSRIRDELEKLKAAGSGPAASQDDDGTRRLTLAFGTERDIAVLTALHRAAADERRTPEAQALHMLEQALDAGPSHSRPGCSTTKGGEL